MLSPVLKVALTFDAASTVGSSLSCCWMHGPKAPSTRGGSAQRAPLSRRITGLSLLIEQGGPTRAPIISMGRSDENGQHVRFQQIPSDPSDGWRTYHHMSHFSGSDGRRVLADTLR